MSPLEEQLRSRIAREGSISVADYMAAANTHYYASHDPFGVDGDFITAPEISQMFGELIGIWLADLWLRAHRPAAAHYVELGPGRGTLAADALRAMRGVKFTPPVALLETSPVLREAQARRVPHARWHGEVASLPDTGPLLIVANEFFDALPVHQYGPDGEELHVTFEEGRFRRSGQVVRESSPASVAIVQDIARRLSQQSGAALIIDYGHDRPGTGDTLQAVHGHRYADPWVAPGSRDLTAHVDFAALAEAARAQGARVWGPVTQGRWLESMGIHMRAAALAKSAPERTEEIATACDRLTAPDQMGRLFKVLALSAPDCPEPAGF